MRWTNTWYALDMYGNYVDPYYEPDEYAKDPDEF